LAYATASRLPATDGTDRPNQAESGRKQMYANEAASTGEIRENGLYVMVAGAGFEPATFGL
jgi:hypothetical protein